MPTLPRSTRLCSREDIDRVFTHGRSVRAGQVAIRYFLREPDSEHPIRVAYVVARRHVKTAVRRNQLRRLLRETYRLIRHDVEASVPQDMFVDAVLMWNGESDQSERRDFSSIQNDVATAMRVVIRKLRNK